MRQISLNMYAYSSKQALLRSLRHSKCYITSFGLGEDFLHLDDANEPEDAFVDKYMLFQEIASTETAVRVGRVCLFLVAAAKKDRNYKALPVDLLREVASMLT
jgi:hypothetical protein